jgi:hypothetical protein
MFIRIADGIGQESEGLDVSAAATEQCTKRKGSAFFSCAKNLDCQPRSGFFDNASDRAANWWKPRIHWVEYIQTARFARIFLSRFLLLAT